MTTVAAVASALTNWPYCLMQLHLRAGTRCQSVREQAQQAEYRGAPARALGVASDT
jgi:hypothetical protein